AKPAAGRVRPRTHATAKTTAPLVEAISIMYHACMHDATYVSLNEPSSAAPRMRRVPRPLRDLVGTVRGLSERPHNDRARHDDVRRVTRFRWKRTIDPLQRAARAPWLKSQMPNRTGRTVGHKISLREAFRTWLRVASLTSFHRCRSDRRSDRKS